MSRKGENIYRRKDGRWESRYIKSRDNGKINYGYVYAKTYREVKQRLIECYSSYSLPVNSEAVSLPTDSFVTVAEECFAVSRSQLKASSSVKYYAIVNKHLIPTFSGELISNISRESIIQLSNRLLSDENSLSLSPKAVTSIMCVLKSIFDYASQVKQYRVPDIRGISIRQLQCQLRILMCLYTGLRLGEICALKWGDILLNEKITYVHQTMQRLKTVDIETKKTEILISTPKSDSSVRRIPIPDQLFKLITQQSFSENAYFLTGSENDYIEPRTMQNKFKKILAACGIDHANFHALRHTFATRCIELGFDVKA